MAHCKMKYTSGAFDRCIYCHSRATSSKVMYRWIGAFSLHKGYFWGAINTQSGPPTSIINLVSPNFPMHNKVILRPFPSKSVDVRCMKCCKQNPSHLDNLIRTIEGPKKGHAESAGDDGSHALPQCKTFYSQWRVFHNHDNHCRLGHRSESAERTAVHS